MSKALVMYYSVYGTTKKYAQWIAEELNAEICERKKADQNSLANYDTIVLGSGLYAGVIQGLDLIIKNYEVIKNKKLVLFTCGLADYSNQVNINNIQKRIDVKLPENIRSNVKVFFLQGGVNYKELSFIHKIMMGMVKLSIKRKSPNKRNDEDKEFLKTYGQTLDFTSKKNIAALVSYCKS